MLCVSENITTLIKSDDRGTNRLDSLVERTLPQQPALSDFLRAGYNSPGGLLADDVADITAAGTEATGTRRNANSGEEIQSGDSALWEEAAVRWQRMARRGETEKENPGGYLGKHVVTSRVRGWPRL